MTKDIGRIGALALLFGSAVASSSEGFVLKAGGGETLLNGTVIKLSPASGTDGSILVEQTFPRGASTNPHLHARVVSESDRPMTAEELADMEEWTGGGNLVK
jgi:hypothetical protein